MPKKRRSTLYSKPPSTTHRPLSSARINTSGAGRRDDTPSVTELLMTLRASRISSDNQRAPPVIVPSMPSEIQQLLDLPDTSRPLPRTRTRRQVDAMGRRLPAGPAPPMSWLESPNRVPAHGFRQENLTQRNRSSVDRLPGASRFPAKLSLIATCMRHMARNWSFHRGYNRYCMATLPTEIRTILLSYIATYGPEEGVGYEGLKAIMRPGDGMLKDFSGNEDFKRLDLSGTVGRSITFTRLQGLIAPTRTTEDDEESWDVATSQIPPSLNAPLRSLRMLSLSSPPHSISWAKFLAFATSIPTVTHLSLANWPAPSLTPNSMAAVISSRYSPNFHAGGTNYYSYALDSDYSEAASVLRRLSNALYSLEWLDVDGCEEWSPALSWNSASNPGIDWKERWGKVRNVSLHSRIVLTAETASHRDIVRYKEIILHALELEKHIRQQRGWIAVEHDEWERYDSLWRGVRENKIERAYENAKMGKWDETE